ncbi:MAG: transposase domain-containing protein [Candidatus Sumerlaeota bacterium]|nr:transposase domain-containing protein [Candidatus Sumerlaeota bacterium]
MGLPRLPTGARITDYISIGVLAKAIPLAAVRRVLAETGRASRRQRLLPAHVMVYYVVFMALFMDTSYGRRGDGLLCFSHFTRSDEMASAPALNRPAVRHKQTTLKPLPPAAQTDRTC